MSDKPKIRTFSIKHEPSHFKKNYIYNKNENGFYFHLSLGHIIHPKLGSFEIKYKSYEDSRY